MRKALRLAARARGDTAPNPMVGAIVVKGGREIATGSHTRAGRPHAEALALRRADRQARGSVLYVTLEPCASWGRTPPCLDAVLEARPRRVVIGMRDPDPRTAGRSVARMRRAGIQVAIGVEEARARDLNRGFISRVERGRPFTVLKLASTLDGRIATASGESRWITGPESRAFVHRLRRRVDAIAVGSQTLLADDPELTARRAGRVLHRPVRIVIDSQARTPPGARAIDPADPGRAWVLAARGAPERRVRALQRAGAHVVRLRSRGAHLDLRVAWRALGELGVNELLVEGGGGLAAALLRARLVDRLHWLVAPRLIGGDGRPVLGSLGVERLSGALRLPAFHSRRLGPDLLLTAEW
jgi:diaminohydroxyphosphoribosylaminopyrimidine deaminase/5-amino-6-(5-phosphoribosylamino)uracil reductase